MTKDRLDTLRRLSKRELARRVLELENNQMILADSPQVLVQPVTNEVLLIEYDNRLFIDSKWSSKLQTLQMRLNQTAGHINAVVMGYEGERRQQLLDRWQGKLTEQLIRYISFLDKYGITDIEFLQQTQRYVLAYENGIKEALNRGEWSHLEALASNSDIEFFAPDFIEASAIKTRGATFKAENDFLAEKVPIIMKRNNIKPKQKYIWEDVIIPELLTLLGYESADWKDGLIEYLKTQTPYALRQRYNQIKINRK